MIRENIEDIRRNIEAAARRSGRRPDAVRLIAVTKEAGIGQIREAVAAGIRDIGENRVQDALLKFKSIDGSVTRHFIGHLQTNKARDAVRAFHLIHSLDSVRLAREIDKEAARLGKAQDVLIELNVAGEKSKFGISPEEAVNFAEEVSRFPNIKVMGLMTVTPLAEDAEESRPYFRRLRELAIEIEKKNMDNLKMEHLSMGMTQDYGVAVEEGATMVRVGRAIFKD